MAERRTLTPAEKAASKRLDSALSSAGQSNESVAAAVGVTAGAVGHWRRGEVAVPLRRAAHVAKIAGLDPSEICIEWQEHVAPHLQYGQSQDARLDTPTLASAIRLLELLAEMRLTPPPAVTAEAIVVAYETIQAAEGVLDESNVLDFMRAFDVRNEQGKRDRDGIVRGKAAGAG